MGRTLEDIIASESPEVVQRAKALAEASQCNQIAFKSRYR